MPAACTTSSASTCSPSRRSRQGIKDYANWPTIPQLYVNGEFVGGSDIVREMYESGELQKLLQGITQRPSVAFTCAR